MHQLLQRMTQLHIHAYNTYILKLVLIQVEQLEGQHVFRRQVNAATAAAAACMI